MVASNWSQQRYIYFYPQLQINLIIYFQPLTYILLCKLSACYLSMQKSIKRYSQWWYHHNYNLFITVVAAGVAFPSTRESNNL